MILLHISVFKYGFSIDAVHLGSPWLKSYNGLCPLRHRCRWPFPLWEGSDNDRAWRTSYSFQCLHIFRIKHILLPVFSVQSAASNKHAIYYRDICFKLEVERYEPFTTTRSVFCSHHNPHKAKKESLISLWKERSTTPKSSFAVPDYIILPWRSRWSTTLCWKRRWVRMNDCNPFGREENDKDLWWHLAIFYWKKKVFLWPKADIKMASSLPRDVLLNASKMPFTWSTSPSRRRFLSSVSFSSSRSFVFLACC